MKVEMKGKAHATARIKGVLNATPYGIFIDERELRDIFREILENETVIDRPGEVCISVVLEEQGVEIHHVL